MPDLLSFLGGFAQPTNQLSGLLGNLAQQLVNQHGASIAQKDKPAFETMGRNRIQVPTGGSTGYFDAFGNFHFGQNMASQ